MTSVRREKSALFRCCDAPQKIKKREERKERKRRKEGKEERKRRKGREEKKERKREKEGKERERKEGERRGKGGGDTGKILEICSKVHMIWSCDRWLTRGRRC